MVSKSTRPSRKKQRTVPGEPNDGANVNASRRDIETDVEATATGAENGTESPIGRTSTTNVKYARRSRKTSEVWKHFTEIFVEETLDDMVIKKPMAACLYCDGVLSAPSRQGGRIVHKCCSRLDPQVIEALICSKDWIRASRNEQSVSSIVDNLASLCTNDIVGEDEGALADAGDNSVSENVSAN